ncbi:cytidine/deoxycytidylate deaminase family protein [Clostridium sp. CAG:448]|nr:cytidine/deoxycytidylate deaminase family protein [Clostridium sp. CAG:448]
MGTALPGSAQGSETAQGIGNDGNGGGCRGGGDEKRAVESTSGNIYVGVCVDSACTLGICAERNAIFNMLTNGEDAIRRVVAVNRDGKVLAPCGACRELMAQLMPDRYREIEVMMDYETGEVVTLGALMPRWWI